MAEFRDMIFISRSPLLHLHFLPLTTSGVSLGARYTKSLIGRKKFLMIEYATSRKVISADIVLHLRYDNEFAKKRLMPNEILYF